LGYASDELLATRDLIEEKYCGIRPAPGYPAQPDHTEKATLFRLIDGERIGVKLTESFAMWPGASVCGLYFGHPDAHYFGVGKIERDQVEDYAERKGWPVTEAERWLAPCSITIRWRWREKRQSNSIRQRVHILRHRREPVRDRSQRIALHLVGRQRHAATVGQGTRRRSRLR